MNQLSNTLERTAGSPPVLHSSTEWHSIVNDPASLIILTALRSRKSHSLDSFLDLVPSDFHTIAKKIVSHLESRGDLQISEGNISLLNRDNFELHDRNALPKFLPTLNMNATLSAIVKSGKGIPANSVRFIAVPRNKLNLKKIKEATDRYHAELLAIASADGGDSEVGLAIQFVSCINTEIKMEDLV